MLETTSTLLKAELLGAGDAWRAPGSLLQVGLALLDWSVSGGVGIMNCVPVKLSGFFCGESSCGAGLFLGLVFGSTGEDSISSMGDI
jgi:hypothetical protein